MSNKFRNEVNEIKREMNAMSIIELTDIIQMENTEFNDPSYIYTNFFGVDYNKSPLFVAKIELINEMMDFVLCEDGLYRFIDK